MGKHEWVYAQQQHQKALKTEKGLVDHSVPKSINPQAQSVQAATRRFFEDKKHAEIGRENQKLVNRLGDIAKGDRPADPRGPPPRTAPASAPATVAAFSLQARKRPSAAAAAIAAQEPVQTRSLHEPWRKENQRVIGIDNASLVRRILATWATMDRRKDTRDFERHTRTVGLLQRFQPEKSKESRHSRSLPAIRPTRLAGQTLSTPSRGMENLLLPWDLGLQRFEGA